MDAELQNLLDTYADMMDAMSHHGFTDKGTQAEITRLLYKALTEDAPFFIEDEGTAEEPFVAEMEKEGKRNSKVIRFPGAHT